MSTTPRLAALVLAAGRSTRMGAENKLLAELDGKALVRHVAEAAAGCGAEPVVVITGHDADAVEAQLAGLPIQFVRNPDYAEGMSTSLRLGVGALPTGLDGAIVLLGDMPLVSASLLRRLVAAFDAEPGGIAAVPLHEGEWGNPVILAAALFPEIGTLQGDAGARKLLVLHADRVIEVPVSDPAVAVDVDTPEVLQGLRQKN